MWLCAEGNLADETAIRAQSSMFVLYDRRVPRVCVPAPNVTANPDEPGCVASYMTQTSKPDEQSHRLAVTGWPEVGA
jgi:hypothetical protein